MFTAGARRINVILWPDEGGRQAQIALLNSEYKPPYYWTPFILIGNGF